MSSTDVRAAEAGGPTRPRTGETDALAAFVVGLRVDAVPASVRQVLRAAVIDAVGCGIFGLTTPAGRIVRMFAAEQGGPAQATLWAGQGNRVSSLHAALSMGTAIHAFDFDDHHRAKVHPGAAVLPAVLALAEPARASGATCLTALAAGYETMIRVSLAANPAAARMRGWHLTGTCGTFGAAAAAAVVLGLARATTASALGLAGTQSAGLWAFNADGAMSKRLHPGRAAQSGVMAALLAQRGFRGPSQILEAPDGGFLAASSDASRPEEITRDLGRVWRTEAVCFKPYACCGSNHASVDAALALRRTHGFAAEHVRKVVVGVSRVVERQTGFPYRASTVLNAQMSLRYNLAVALIDGQVLLPQFTARRIVDKDACDLASRVEVEVDPDIDAIYPERYAGVVTVVLRNGRELRQRVDSSKGMPENQMTMDDLCAKFQSLVRAATGASAGHILDQANALFEAPDAAPLTEALGQVRLLERAS